MANFRQGNNQLDPSLLNALQDQLGAAMRQVYTWMCLGLAITTIVAYYVSTSEPILAFVFGTPFVFFGLILLEIAFVIGIQRAIHRLSPTTSLTLFLVYAALNGVTLASVFLYYTGGSIVTIFGGATILFGIMSVVGYTTQQDVSGWGRYLFIGFIGLFVVSIANFFIGSGIVSLLLGYVGVALFLAFTVYYTNRIKAMMANAIMSGNSETVSRVAIRGALLLYISFINLFLSLLRIFGRRR